MTSEDGVMGHCSLKIKHLGRDIGVSLGKDGQIEQILEAWKAG